MNKPDRRKAGMALLAFESMRGRTLDPNHVKLFLDMLPDLSLDEFLRGLALHGRDPDRAGFDLMPADIIRHARGSPKDRALIAWGAFVEAARHVGGWRTVMFADPATSNAVKRLGLWPDCIWTEYEEHSLRERFIALYKHFDGNCRNVELPGRAAIENRRRGFLKGRDYVSPPRLAESGAKDPVAVIGADGLALPPSEARRLLKAAKEEDRSGEVIAKLKELTSGD